MHLVSQQTLRGTSGKMCFFRLQLLAHIVRRMAFNPQLADHAVWIQLGATSMCITPSENKPTVHLPLVRTKRGGHSNICDKLFPTRQWRLGLGVNFLDVLEILHDS